MRDVLGIMIQKAQEEIEKKNSAPEPVRDQPKINSQFSKPWDKCSGANGHKIVAPDLPVCVQRCCGGLTTAKNIQKSLKELGYYNGPIDGDIGPGSRNAISKWEHKNEAVLDGALSAREYEELMKQAGDTTSEAKKEEAVKLKPSLSTDSGLSLECLGIDKREFEDKNIPTNIDKKYFGKTLRSWTDEDLESLQKFHAAHCPHNYVTNEDTRFIRAQIDKQLSLEIEQKRKLEKNIDKSKGGYKSFYFDMSKAQILSEIDNVCPNSFKTKGLFELPTDLFVSSCVELKGERRELYFKFSKDLAETKRIVVLLGGSSGTIISESDFTDETGFAEYDFWVSQLKKNAKYKLFSKPTHIDRENFNRTIGSYGEIAFVFENIHTGNLVKASLNRESGDTLDHFVINLSYHGPYESDEIKRSQAAQVIEEDDL